jgi:hypothetical protein
MAARETPTLKFIEGTPLNETYSGEIFSTTTTSASYMRRPSARR